MVQRIWMAGVLAIWAAVAGGCCVDRTGCAGGACGPMPGNGLTVDGCGDCGGACGGTLTAAIGHTLTCGSGCGNVYYDEWLSDPPDCCDPCDDCGNWTGNRDCCRPLSILRPCNLFGIRYYDDCSPGCTGCDSCGHSGGEVLDVVEEPHPAPPPPPSPATARSKRVRPGPHHSHPPGMHSIVR